MNKLGKNIGISLLIALGAVIIDQIYHIVLNYSHQIFTIFTDPSTIAYIGYKFLLVSLVSLIVLSIGAISNKYLQSLIIAVAAALLFSVLLTYMFPRQYGIVMHMSHGLAIFISSLVVLSFIKNDKLAQYKKGLSQF